MRLTEEQTAEADALNHEAYNSDDIKEGMIAFFEKRKPNCKRRRKETCRWNGTLDIYLIKGH